MSTNKKKLYTSKISSCSGVSAISIPPLHTREGSNKPTMLLLELLCTSAFRASIQTELFEFSVERLGITVNLAL